MKPASFSATAVVWVLVVLAIVTRFWGLGAKTFHHDESVHAWFSSALAEGRGYHYDPVYHGPLLYHLQAATFRAFGTGDAQARSTTALFGVLLVVLAYVLLQPHLGRSGAVAAMALLVVSPTFTYYSRFNSHDLLIAVFTLVLSMAPFAYARTRNGAYVCIFLVVSALAVSTKLNAWFVLSTLLLYSLARVAWGRGRGTPVRLARVWQLVRAPLFRGVAGALAVVVALGATTLWHYFTTTRPGIGAALSETVLSLATDGFEHWAKMQAMQRLPGPFFYYVPLCAIYEPLVLLLSAAALVYYADKRVRCALVALGTGGTVLLLTTLSRTSWLFTVLLRISPIEAGLAAGVAAAGGWVVLSLWRKGRECLAFWLFSGIVQFILYSLAGEKVPWLTIHVLLPWIVVSAVCSVDLWRDSSPARRVALAAVLLTLFAQTARSAWIVNTVNRSNTVEPLLQVEFDGNVVATARIIRQADTLTNGAAATVDPAHNWPFGWYVRDVNVDYAKDITGTETTPVLLSAVAPAGEVQLRERYIGRVLPYLTWNTWLTRASAFDAAGMLRFMLLHDRWGEAQRSQYQVWVRRDVALQLGWPTTTEGPPR